MQSSGNLVLADGGNRILWQSFDHPTDTLVLGANLTHKMSLVAASSAGDSSEGSYKMVMEAQGLVLYSTLGTSPIPQPYMTRGYGRVDNNWVKYTEVRNNILDSECTSLPAFCGPYIASVATSLALPSSSVRVLSSSIMLQTIRRVATLHGTKHLVFKGSSVNPDTEMLELHDRLVAPTALNVTLEECKTMCLLSCSCAASFHQYDNDRYQPTHNHSWYNKTRFADRTTCFLVDSLNSMFTILPEQELWTSNLCPYSAFVKFSRQAVTDRTDNSTFSSARKLAVGISSGAALFIVTATLVCVFVLRHAMSGSESGDDEGQEAFLGSLPGLPPRFSFNELDRATNHFIKVLGEGGFGTVYEGVLLDGSKVAVKRLGGSKQGQKGFRAEVATIGGINHLCLVRLWGFCSEACRSCSTGT
jgi:hypothetical protein